MSDIYNHQRSGQQKQSQTLCQVPKPIDYDAENDLRSEKVQNGSQRTNPKPQGTNPGPTDVPPSGKERSNKKKPFESNRSRKRELRKHLATQAVIGVQVTIREPDVAANEGAEVVIENSMADDEWFRVPTPVAIATEIKVCTDLSVTIDRDALFGSGKKGVVAPQGPHGKGVASQILLDAPYFATAPNIGSYDRAWYNPTYYKATSHAAATYMTERVLRPLLNPTCIYHERFALEVYRQRACRILIEELEANGIQIPKGKKALILDQNEILQNFLRTQLRQLPAGAQKLIKQPNSPKFEPFKDLPAVLQYLSIAKRAKDLFIDELVIKIKKFESRLGKQFAEDGPRAESNVWKYQIPRMVKEVLAPRYANLVHMALSSKQITVENLGRVRSFSEAEVEQPKSNTDVTLLMFFRSVLETQDQTLATVAFWVTKCQGMLLTDDEVALVRSDRRFVRIYDMLHNMSDTQVDTLFAAGRTVGTDNLRKRVASLAQEKAYLDSQKLYSTTDSEITEVVQETASAPDKPNTSICKRASIIRQSILSYLAFWIYCDQLNNGLAVKGLGPLPFFHFVTEISPYKVNREKTGELDGILLDLSKNAPQILNVFEIKSCAQDITGALKQRDRFLCSVWTAMCRQGPQALAVPAHQNWYTMRGDECGDKRMNEIDPNLPQADANPIVHDNDVIICPQSKTMLPPFYQLIFPLVSHNAANLLLPSSALDDTGCPASATDSSLHLACQQTSPKNNIVPSEVRTRMLGMWIFVTFIVVDSKGIPVVPSARLLGMGHNRHMLCQEAAVLYAAASEGQTPKKELWSDVRAPDGIVGKLFEAQINHKNGKETAIVGPYLTELTEFSPKQLVSPAIFRLPRDTTKFFSDLASMSIRTIFGSSQKSNVSSSIPCPQELVSELSRANFLSSLLLCPIFE